MAEDTVSSRLTRIETTQQYHSDTLARVAIAVESIAVISERMANHIEDARRIHERLDRCEMDIVNLQTQAAETTAFYRDIKRGMIALITAALAGGAWLISFWMEKH